MSLNKYLEYEQLVFESLSPALNNKGWVLKREHKSKAHLSYDIALYYKNVLCTFIEIRHNKSKKTINRAKKAGEGLVRKLLHNTLNYGILFINGKLFIVGKNSSEQIKSFPKPSDYNWKNKPSIKSEDDISFQIDSASLSLENYTGGYDTDSVKDYGILLEIDKLKQENISLKKENISLKQENTVLSKKLIDKIAYTRDSSSDEELKIKLLDRYFLSYLSSSKKTMNYKNNWCNNWNKLEVNSKIFIEESENLYETLKVDYTAFVQGFAKALETEILMKIFNNFLIYFKENNTSIDDKINDNANKGTIKVFRSFLKNGDLNTFLSLDRMRFIIAAIFSDTNDKLLLEFRTVYLKYFKQMKGIFEDKGSFNILKNIRNKGAHIEPIDKDLADTFYVLFKSTFNEIMCNYKFPVKE